MQTIPLTFQCVLKVKLGLSVTSIRLIKLCTQKNKELLSNNRGQMQFSYFSKAGFFELVPRLLSIMNREKEKRKKENKHGDNKKPGRTTHHLDCSKAQKGT